MTLDDLLAAASSLAIDSRRVQRGALFVALRGERTDGHQFIDDAIARGAVGVVMEEARPMPAGIPSVVVPDSAKSLSYLASRFYREPSRALDMIGVTGTNGKTTTTHMIASILNAAERPCGLIGTLGASFGTETWNLANTTPLAHELHELLAHMRDDGARCVAMEVSSHALALARVEDIAFQSAVFTNLTRDHLDFHGTFEAYAAAKHRLFEVAQRIIVNVDDPFGAHLAAEFAGSKPVLSYAIDAPADVQAGDVVLDAKQSRFTVQGIEFIVPMPGRFNVLNALAAICVARERNVDLRVAAQALGGIERVPGRMETLHECGVTVVVDYSHTPDSLENALRALREGGARRLTVVFGCGGDRDRGKRPLMGAIAGAYADRVVLTSDNPRSEDPQTIIDEIAAGIKAAHVIELVDRRMAIEMAVASAEDGETVLVAGKGHEPYQIIGDQVLPFNDRDVAAKSLANRAQVSRCS